MSFRLQHGVSIKQKAKLITEFQRRLTELKQKRRVEVQEQTDNAAATEIVEKTAEEIKQPVPVQIVQQEQPVIVHQQIASSMSITDFDAEYDAFIAAQKQIYDAKKQKKTKRKYTRKKVVYDNSDCN